MGGVMAALGPSTGDPAECVPPERLAQLFGKSKSWVYTMARQGHIPCVRVGGSWLFPRRALERWLEGAGEKSRAGGSRVERGRSAGHARPSTLAARRTAKR